MSDYSDEYDDYGVESAHDGKNGNLAVANALRAAVGDSTKKRRPVAKLDFERLMGDKGFRYLRERHSNLVLTNQTEVDINTILRLYKEWADFMFPKLPFGDVLRRIDRLSKTHRSMRIYGRALREELEAGREFDEAAFLTGMALEESEAVLGKD